jgi:hypothetical protein
MRNTVRNTAALAVLSGLACLSVEAATTIPCLVPGANSAVTVTAPGATAARLYFRKSGTPNFYYLELRSAPTGFWGVLPKPDQGTSVEYAAETTTAGGTPAREEAAVLAPAAGCGPVLDAEQSKLANNLVVGQTAPSDNVPPGFECQGIVSVITPDNKLESNSCTNPLPYYVVGGAALVAGGVIIYDNNHRNNHHASQFRP